MNKIQIALTEGLKACKEIFERDYFGNHTVKLSDFDPIKKRFERAEQELAALCTKIDTLKRRNERLEAEVKALKDALRAYGDEDIDADEDDENE